MQRKKFLNLKQLTSNKNRAIYLIIYSIYLILSTASPVFIMLFIDACVAKNTTEMIVYGSISIAEFVLIQVFGYFYSMVEDRIERENYSLFFTRLDEIVKNKDFVKSDIDDSRLNQAIGQNYELSKYFFFLKQANLVLSIIQIVAIFAVMFVINWMMSLILLILVPFFFLITKLMENKLYGFSKKNIDNMEDIKAYVSDENTLSKENRFLSKKQLTSFIPFINKYQRDNLKNSRYRNAYLWFLAYCFLNLTILIIMLVAGYLTSVEVISIGVIFAFWNYTSQLWSPGEYMMSYTIEYQEAKPAMDDLEDLLSTPICKYNEDPINSIELRDFSPLDKDLKPLTDKKNYSFENGKVYLILGPNGAGKTTMIESILGFTSRYSGTILINGKEEKSNNLVYVPADAYISKFYDEELAKGSSGQQKLTQIELSVETDKSLYIFDEPTNFVDKENKDEVVKVIEKLKSKHKLVIIVSHDKIFLDKDYEKITIS